MKLCQACQRCFPDASRACVEPAHPPLVEGPPIDPAVGDTWVLERLLFSDSAGGSFIARSRKTGLSASLLVRCPPVEAHDALFALFVHESTLLANLEELSIAGVEELGPLADGGAYAVLESAGDETLRELIDREGRLSISFAASIGRQVGEAAASLAESGILPGALTSDRVGIRRRELRPAVRLARFPGTVLLDAEGAEIPTLGGLLYEMLSGQPAATHAGTGQPPPPIQRARPDLPESLGWLVMQCLHPSATARPRSLAEIVRRLSPFEQVAAESPRQVEIPAEPSLPVAAEPPIEALRLPAPPPTAVSVQPPPPEETTSEYPSPAAVIPTAAEEALAEDSLPPRPLAIEPAFQPAFAVPERPIPPRVQEQEQETAETTPPNPASAPMESAPVVPVSLERAPGLASSGNPEASGVTPPAPATSPARPASPPALPWAAELAADFRNRQPKSSPADSAITAEIPILRPRYSYRNTPHPPPVKQDDDAGPRPMFLEPPPPPPSAPVPFVASPPPPPAAPARPSTAGAWRSRPPVSRGGSFEIPRESSPSGSIRNRRNFPPPPAPPFGGPSFGSARTLGGPLSGSARAAPPRPALSSRPGRQIPISEERREARSPAPEDAASSSVAAKEPVDSGIGGVTVGEDRTGEFETGRKGPRPGLVWGIAAAIAAGIFALFWFVIEATPPRKDAAPVGGRLGRKEVETSPVRATAAPGAAAAPISGDVTAAAEPAPASRVPAAVSAPPVPDAPAVTAPSTSGPSSVKSRLPASSRESEPAPPPAESRNTLGPAKGGLRDALDAWVDSTNARDLSGHMRFYLPRVNTFYLTRNVSRDFIRQEKARLFHRGPVSVAAGEPEIDPSPDGRTATVRFRKRYAVSGARGEKRGEVLQEMKWVRTPDGWRIASERDAKVLASR
ncbi:MAG: hypothetical protein ABI682_08220 [Acidobacteriota bacterium]